MITRLKYSLQLLCVFAYVLGLGSIFTFALMGFFLLFWSVFFHLSLWKKMTRQLDIGREFPFLEQVKLTTAWGFQNVAFHFLKQKFQLEEEIEMI